MAEDRIFDDKEWTRGQVEEYKKRYERYTLFAETLNEVLRQAAKKHAPLSIVQTRPKGISNFADKCQRKKATHGDPVNQFTDLCGGRMIVHTAEEIAAVSAFIENHFEIDQENTVDVSQRLKPTEFGYRSVHYIVSFKEGVFPTPEVGVEVPPLLCDDENFPNRRAEIQVRTVLEHGWADIAHALVYKSPFEVPVKWEREFAGVAAMLESADKTFSRVKRGLSAYAASFGAYMTEEQLRSEMKSKEIVLEHDPANLTLVAQIAELAMILGDWQKVHRVLEPYVAHHDPVVLRLFGINLCKMGRAAEGRAYLEKAIAPPGDDLEALIYLAGICEKPGVDEEERARALYNRAYQKDPSYPYLLESYLDFELAIARNMMFVSLLTPMIEKAIGRCDDQAEVGMNLPWAFYMRGKFNLVLNRPYESLDDYAKAIQVSTSPWMIQRSLERLEKLKKVAGDLSGYEWVRRLLLIGKAVWAEKKAREMEAQAGTAPEAAGTEDRARQEKYRQELVEMARAAKEKLHALASKEQGPTGEPVVIVAGGCDPAVEKQMGSYRQLVKTAFEDFEGTVIGGGTQQGVSGLVGEVGTEYGDRVRTIGYLPRYLPSDATRDARYSELRITDGHLHSPIESLQSWIDLIAAGIDPSGVKVLGINGGDISALEFRIALALGARVGVMEESGREVARLLRDEKWVGSEKLLPLPHDVTTVQYFIGSRGPKLDRDVREKLGKKIHETYRQTKRAELEKRDPALKNWEALAEEFRESSAQQADDIFRKLERIGCTVESVKHRDIEPIELSAEEIEMLAEREHGRWNAERLLDGWSWGETKDLAQKKSPHLASWDKLPEHIKEWDRHAIREIPKLLASIGLEIKRKEDA